jgi:hypothetical protein
VILTEVLRAGEVTSHLVVGTVCVYLMLALTWTFLYYAIEALAPGAILVRVGSFSGTALLPVADAEANKILYVSLATITTLGNSDIPVTFLARLLATIEAITAKVSLSLLGLSGRVPVGRVAHPRGPFWGHRPPHVSKRVELETLWKGP